MSGKDTKVKCLDFGNSDQIVGVEELEKKHNWTGESNDPLRRSSTH